MENMPETPTKQPIQSVTTARAPFQDQQQVDPISPNSNNDLRKICTPDRLKVPKAFKYPERYQSPTDLMVSPVTKGLLARNRKAGGSHLPSGSHLPPSINQAKARDIQVQEVVSLKFEM